MDRHLSFLGDVRTCACLVALGLLPDTGVIGALEVPQRERLLVVVILQFMFAFTFVFARMSQSTTRRVVGELGRRIGDVVAVHAHLRVVRIGEQGVAHPHVHVGEHGFAPAGLRLAFVLMQNKAVPVFGHDGFLGPERRAASNGQQTGNKQTHGQRIVDFIKRIRRDELFQLFFPEGGNS